jgi:hypothetical protein
MIAYNIRTERAIGEASRHLRQTSLAKCMPPSSLAKSSISETFREDAHAPMRSTFGGMPSKSERQTYLDDSTASRTGADALGHGVMAEEPPATGPWCTIR